MVGESAALSDALAAILEQRLVPGGAFAWFGTEGPWVAAAAGVRRKHRTAPVTVDDWWHIGSVTKSITANVMIALHDHGVLDLDESVASGLARTPWERYADAEPWHRATVRDLLTHRSGMRANPSYALFSRYVLWGEPVSRTNHAATRQALTRGIGPHGTYLYSNCGYGIAGAIARARTGSLWQELVIKHYRERHQVPLGFGRPEWYGRHPWGHRRRVLGRGYASFRINKRGLDLDLMRPAGDVQMPLAGLVAHGRHHLSQMAAGVTAAYEPHGDSADPDRGGGYGLGWRIEDRARDFGERMIWHNGSDLFSFTLLGLLPESGQGFVWVTNALQRDWRSNPGAVWEPVRDLVELARTGTP